MEGFVLHGEIHIEPLLSDPLLSNCSKIQPQTHSLPTPLKPVILALS